MKIKSDIKSKLAETDQLLDEIKNLSTDEQKRKNEDVKGMIEYFNGMTNVIEERRNKIYESSLTLIAIIVSALTIAYMNFSSWNELIAIPFTFILILLLSLFILVIIFYIQNKSNYVFKETCLLDYTNKWKWFYYGNKNIQKVNVSNIKEDSILNYIEGLNFFLKNYKNEDTTSELNDNLQQLYLLQVHNYYKNRYYLILVSIQRIGLYFAIFGAAIASLIIIL